MEQEAQAPTPARAGKESELDGLLDEHLPKLGAKPRKLIKDALAIAAYRNQRAWPVVELLICDDAPQCNWLTVALALCWIHEYRHLTPLWQGIGSGIDNAFVMHRPRQRCAEKLDRQLFIH